MTSKPKIFCFSNTVNGDEGVAYAMAEDGTVLASHFCSSELYVPHDLGIINGCRPDRHEAYKQHYPDGYELEFVSARDVASHPGISLAYERNQELGKSTVNK